MQAIVFPSLETLRLALANGVIAPAIALRPVRAGQDRLGRLWTIPDGELPHGAAALWQRLGAAVSVSPESVEYRSLTCWHQIVPLATSDFFPPPGSAVVLELPNYLVSSVAAEIERLAPNCHKVRIFEGNDQLWLYVDEPPMSVLLRCQLRHEMTAFVERAPRVWIEAGWQHPLQKLLSPPGTAGRIIRGSNQWRWIDNCGIEPQKPLIVEGRRSVKSFEDSRGRTALPIPLRLIATDRRDNPEVWLVQHEPLEQLQRLVEQSSDAALAGWEYALASAGENLVVVLRAKRSRHAPADLAVSTAGFVPYLRMPNLYLPAGMMLQPPLRRDQARRWLADSDDHISLLLPNGDSTFAVARVRSHTFQPLLQACEYKAPVARHWEPVRSASPLPFELFSIVADPVSEPIAAVRRPIQVPASLPQPEPAEPSGLFQRLRRLFQSDGDEQTDVTGLVQNALPEMPAAGPSEVSKRRLKHQERRIALEERLRQSLAPEHVADRSAIWPQLAGAHADLGQFTEAAACWLNALWESDSLPPLWLRGWLQAEKMLSRIPLLEDDLLTLLHMPPTPAGIRTLAACTVVLAQQDPAPPALVAYAERIRQRLDAGETWLPIRAAWLAQCALARVSQGDVLALARTRDRLLERLFQHGLSLEQDIPSFLRFSGRQAGEKFPFVRDWLQRVRDAVHRWIDGLVKQRPSDYALTLPANFADRDGRCTKAYADLMLAWGLARLGEASAARHHYQSAVAPLAETAEPAAALVVRIFDFRIQQQLDHPHDEPLLPGPLSDDLQRLSAPPFDERRILAAYSIDALRARSRILDGNERRDVFRQAVTARFSDGIALEAAQWPDLPDGELARSIGSLLHEHSEDLNLLSQVLESALRFTRRLGEKRSMSILERAEHVLEILAPGTNQMLLLDQTLTAAAQFSMIEVGKRSANRLFRFLARREIDFLSLVRSCRPPTPKPELLEEIEQWPSRCLRSLRRLGLQSEFARLWPRLREWVLASGSLARARGVQSEVSLPALRALLHLVGEQTAEVNDQDTTLLLDLARRQLLYDAGMRNSERVSLACAYVSALGRSPVRMAHGRIEELLRDLTRVHDRGQTNAFYALSPLRIVDAIVRAVVNEDFSQSPAMRRWLVEDDFRIRRRMQRDLHAMIAQGNV